MPVRTYIFTNIVGISQKLRLSELEKCDLLRSSNTLNFVDTTFGVTALVLKD